MVHWMTPAFAVKPRASSSTRAMHVAQSRGSQWVKAICSTVDGEVPRMAIGGGAPRAACVACERASTKAKHWTTCMLAVRQAPATVQVCGHGQAERRQLGSQKVGTNCNGTVKLGTERRHEGSTLAPQDCRSGVEPRCMRRSLF
mmetsp:Transcript_56889/g.151874  ORF Transcript_56889/g.151874 Transcript_56889/m.151874 type:complete len:144 (+) Transcript_56889:126-557(+)